MAAPIFPSHPLLKTHPLHSNADMMRKLHLLVSGLEKDKTLTAAGSSNTSAAPDRKQSAHKYSRGGIRPNGGADYRQRVQTRV